MFNFIEKQGSVFDSSMTNSDLYYAHCVSADFAMGMGIAVEFDRRFNLKEQLKRIYNKNSESCILLNHVFNLITKEKYWHKPTYISLKKAVLEMKAICLDKNIKEIHMPRIGCGLDGLSWIIVKQIIQNIFRGTDIKIIVYYL